MVSQFDDHSAIHQASLILLEQMGVVLTQRAKNELLLASTPQYINAQTALSQGILAQQRGTVVEALTYYYKATSFDPTILEAINRATTITSVITSGNIGENVRNDIQHRNQWIKVLREAERFFKAHPPYEIIYDPSLMVGAINYKNETVDVYINARLRAQKFSYKIISDLSQGLKNTGKAVDWGLANWPNSGEAAIFIGNNNIYQITIALINENGIILGYTKGEFKSGDLSFSHDYGTLIFKNINANNITNNMKISVTRINNIDVKNIEEQNIIGIISDNVSYADIFNFRINNTAIEITGYNGTQKDIIIPSSINGITVKTIGNEAFININSNNNTKLNSVLIPNSIISIGNDAFAYNQLTNVVIPDSVLTIGDRAFYVNQLTDLIIGKSVAKIGVNAFGNNKLTNLVIPNTVTIIGVGAFSSNRLNKVLFGNSVVEIHSEAFKDNQLTNIIFPNSITVIGSAAFHDNNIVSITIPANVRTGGNLYSFHIKELNGMWVTDNNIFDIFYRENGRKAGIYNFSSSVFYSPTLKVNMISGNWTYKH